MSLLHRNLVAAAFQEMLQKFEPIAKETAEAVVSIVAPKVSPLATVAIEAAEAIFGQTNSSHVDAAVAAASAPPASATPSAAPVATAPVAAASPAPVVNLAAGQNAAALAAVDALALQLSNLATQLAALRTNIGPQ